MTFSVALKTVNKKNSILRGILTYLCYNVPLGLTYIVTKKIVKNICQPTSSKGVMVYGMLELFLF